MPGKQLANILHPIRVEVVPDFTPNLAGEVQPAGVNFVNGAAVIHRMKPAGDRFDDRVIRVEGGIVVDRDIPVRRSHPVTTHHMVIPAPGINRVIARAAENRVIRPTTAHIGGIGAAQAEGGIDLVTHISKGRYAHNPLKLNSLGLIPGGGGVGRADPSHAVGGCDRAALHRDADLAEEHIRRVIAAGIGEADEVDGG